jgi:hypothetical protein
MSRKTYTHTSRHFCTAKPVSEHFVNVPPNTVPPGRTLGPRLGFGGFSEKQQYSWRALAGGVEYGSKDNLLIFPDAGFITTKMDERLWPSLGLRTIVLVPGVVNEIQGWLKTPYQNEYLARVIRRVLELQDHPVHPDEAFLKRASCNILPPESWLPHSFVVNRDVSDHLRRHGYDHYVKLLKVRKLWGRRVAAEMTARLGRPPEEEDLRNELNRRFGPRNSQIAFKGWKDFGKPNYTADEELVVTAALSAILTGCEVVILTWDTDLQDQYTRLMHQLVADYHAHLFGEAASDPESGLTLGQMPMSKNDWYEGEYIEHLGLPVKESQKLLPPNPYSVPCDCLVLGNHQADMKVTRTLFRAETEMRSMLSVVGETGLTSKRFGDRNIQGGTHLMDEKPLCYFVIGKEKKINFEGEIVSALEAERAMGKGEIIVRVNFMHQSSAENENGNENLPPT